MTSTKPNAGRLYRLLCEEVIQRVFRPTTCPKGPIWTENINKRERELLLAPDDDLRKEGQKLVDKQDTYGMIGETSSVELGLGVSDLPLTPIDRPCIIPRRCKERELSRKIYVKMWPDASFEVQSIMKDLKPAQRSWDFLNQVRTVRKYVEKMNNTWCGNEVIVFEPDFFDSMIENDEKQRQIWASRKYERIWITCFDIESLGEGRSCNLWI